MNGNKNNKKVIRAWAFFDWANSSYNLVITSTIFPAYYSIITTTIAHGDKVSFFGISFVNTALANYALAAAYLIIALMSPVLTSMADHKGNKKVYMKFFTWLGAVSCCCLFFFKLETLELGVICFALAAIGYAGGFVFYNSYLPEIASPDKQDAVSAKGFSYGYIGSVILQLICFVFVLKPEWFGITDLSFPPRLSFLLVGLWWIGFAQIPFKVLPKGSPNFNAAEQRKISSGFIELQKVWRQIKKMTVMKSFLYAFFFYSMGVQTVMLVATSFGEKVLHLPTSSLIAVILIIQLVAIAGANLMSRFSRIYGNVNVLIAVVLLWALMCICAYFVTTGTQFYILAAIVGLVMGGIQSLSRSTYSKLIPQNTADAASFFSFYDVTEKLAIVAGLASFAYIEELTGSMRNSIIALTSFFILGLFMLLKLKRAEYNLIVCQTNTRVNNI
ncbi:UMF1 family MFS transporter [Pedobacter sp. CG_S7]|uniref:MFS transporter n=1 Tax=Pedobacter sp. CG_S7 TaxID=3143930 RepID=UPI003390C86B